MKNQKLVLASTFVMGLVTGVYLYLMGFAPAYYELTRDINTAESDLIIVGEQYGGCQMLGSCPALRFDDTRDYRYVPYTPREEERMYAEGKLSRPTFTAVVNALEDSDLASLGEPIEPVSCASMVDGIDYNYLISLDGDEYELDTCQTRFTEGSQLGQALKRVWEEIDD